MLHIFNRSKNNWLSPSNPQITKSTLCIWCTYKKCKVNSHLGHQHSYFMKSCLCFSFWFYEHRSEHNPTSTEKRSNTLCSVSPNKVVVCLILTTRTWNQTNGHVYNKDNLLNFVVVEVTIKPHHNSSNLESNWKFSLSRLSKNAKRHGYAVSQMRRSWKQNIHLYRAPSETLALAQSSCHRLPVMDRKSIYKIYLHTSN